MIHPISRYFLKVNDIVVMHRESSSSSHSPSPTHSHRHSLGRALRHFVKPKREPVFVLPEQAKPGPSTVYQRSQSAFYYPLPGEGSIDRKTSEPAHLGSSRCDWISGDWLSHGNCSSQSSSSAQPQSNSGGVGFLSIDTFGGETAGSGMDYVTELVDEETSCNQTIKSAQHLALSNMRIALEEKKKQIIQIETDEVMLRALERDDFGDVQGLKEDELLRELSDLENQLDSLRTTLPSAVPPKNDLFVDHLSSLRSGSFPFLPVRPRRTSPEYEEWRCIKCSSANHFQLFRCIKCGLPRLIASPLEKANCRCVNCSEYVAARLSLTPDDGTDWMLVDSPTR